MITKKQFVAAINALKKQYEQDEECQKAFKVILPSDFISTYPNHHLTNGFVELLANVFNDEGNWIDYFCYDLNFGKDYKKGCATHKNGKEINLSTSEKLYDFLVKEMKPRIK